ncbi:glycosyltransferase [Roseobacter sp. GAI101]|uniref:glycosyltransferase n=1 Tax=Roseobacter sp. (strain GAI101) TaxID=391589 RepID=UPI0018DD0910|nr:glycosyltransferase [Roseobacter sp. GAI101]
MLRESEPVQLKSRYEWGMLALAHMTLDDIVHLTPEAAWGAQKALGRLHRLNKVRIVSNGLDTDFFSPDEISNVSLNPKGTVQLGMISRLQHKKDHETLLKAVAQLIRTRPDQELHLHIAGDGATRSRIEATIARLELGQNVTLHGFLDRDGVRALLARLDIYVHATFGETMSNSIMQAMAMARPVVASDVNGVSNMISEGHGMLYTSGDANALAQRIARWIDDPSEAALYGARARSRAVERFGIANTTRRYEAIARGEPE